MERKENSLEQLKRETKDDAKLYAFRNSTPRASHSKS